MYKTTSKYCTKCVYKCIVHTVTSHESDIRLENHKIKLKNTFTIFAFFYQIFPLFKTWCKHKKLLKIVFKDISTCNVRVCTRTRTVYMYASMTRLFGDENSSWRLNSVNVIRGHVTKPWVRQEFQSQQQTLHKILTVFQVPYIYSVVFLMYRTFSGLARAVLASVHLQTLQNRKKNQLKTWRPHLSAHLPRKQQNLRKHLLHSTSR